jgi:hypothetical protein
MSTRKPATNRPELSEEWLAKIISDKTRPGALQPGEIERLAADILTEIRRLLGSRGGRATKAKYGPEHYSRIGKLGGRPKVK